MPFFLHQQFSSSTIMVVSCLIAAFGLIKYTKLDLITILIFCIALGIGFVIKDHIPARVLMVGAVLITGFAIMKQDYMPVSWRPLLVVALLCVSVFCKWYFTTKTLTGISMLLMAVSGLILIL